MRVCPVILGLVFLQNIFCSQLRGQTCNVGEFLGELAKQPSPKEESLNLAFCAPDQISSLSQEFGRFICNKNSTPTKEKVKAFLGVVKISYSKAPADISYAKFAETIRGVCLKQGVNFDLNNSGTQTQLDQLLNKLYECPKVDKVFDAAVAGNMQALPSIASCDKDFFSVLAGKTSELINNNKRKEAANAIDSIQQALWQQENLQGLRLFSEDLLAAKPINEYKIPARLGPGALAVIIEKLKEPPLPQAPSIPSSLKSLLALLALVNMGLAGAIMALYFKYRKTEQGASARDLEKRFVQSTTERLDAFGRALREVEKSTQAINDAFAAINGRVVTLENLNASTTERSMAFSARLDQAETKLAKLPLDLVTKVSRLEEGFRALQDQTVKLAARTRNLSGSTPGATVQSSQSNPQSATPLSAERDVLREIWRRFIENREISAMVEAATQDTHWRGVQQSLLVELPPTVPDDLRTTFEAVLAPAKDFANLVAKINFVPLLVNGGAPEMKTEAQELARLREFTNLLTMIQNSNLVADRLKFRFERWVEDQFLGFADLFLQRYQKATLDARAGSLETGQQIVCQILQVINLKPIDLILGSTPFDSTRHIGRSTRSEPNYPDGVILEVLRNGFIRGEREVMRQPEVAVNRLR